MMYDDFTFEDLGKGYKVCISNEHRFGTDAFLLADFTRPRHKDKVCDYCTGCGIIALIMRRNFAPKKLYALEIQQKAFEQLKLSIEKSGASEDTFAVLGDLKDWRSPEPLDVITCNPPYKISGTGAKNGSAAVSIARHEIECTIDDVCNAAAKNLRFGGRLCICNRPERLSDIITAMRANGIEPKRLRTVHKNPDCAPWLVLVEGRMGGSNFIQIEKPLYVRSSDGGISEEMQRIYTAQIDKKES
ncbi:MAG: methyltransferase [Ruminococcus sp.]|nr:methyltransferase [Ruminococcus sp.]